MTFRFQSDNTLSQDEVSSLLDEADDNVLTSISANQFSVDCKKDLLKYRNQTKDKMIKCFEDNKPISGKLFTIQLSNLTNFQITSQVQIQRY